AVSTLFPYPTLFRSAVLWGHGPVKQASAPGGVGNLPALRKVPPARTATSSCRQDACAPRQDQPRRTAARCSSKEGSAMRRLQRRSEEHTSELQSRFE